MLSHDGKPYEDKSQGYLNRERAVGCVEHRENPAAISGHHLVPDRTDPGGCASVIACNTQLLDKYGTRCGSRVHTMDFVQRETTHFLTTFCALRIVRLRSRSMTYGCSSTKTGDLLRCALYLLLFGSAESGNAFLFLATLRGALRFLNLNGGFLSKRKSGRGNGKPLPSFLWWLRPSAVYPIPL